MFTWQSSLWFHILGQCLLFSRFLWACVNPVFPNFLRVWGAVSKVTHLEGSRRFYAKNVSHGAVLNGRLPLRSLFTEPMSGSTLDLQIFTDIFLSFYSPQMDTLTLFTRVASGWLTALSRNHYIYSLLLAPTPTPPQRMKTWHEMGSTSSEDYSTGGVPNG